MYITTANIEPSVYGMKRGSTDGGPANSKGPKIRKLREAMGVSQAELARRLQRGGWDIDLMIMNRIELQRRTITDRELERILKALKLRWEDLA